MQWGIGFPSSTEILDSYDVKRCLGFFFFCFFFLDALVRSDLTFDNKKKHLMMNCFFWQDYVSKSCVGLGRSSHR
jgi:hypothetical protein